MNFTTTVRLGVLAATLAAAGFANAAGLVSNSAFNGTTIDFNQFSGLQTTGPLDVGATAGNDVVFTSSPNALLGASSQDLGLNGSWDGRGDASAPLQTPTGGGNFISSQFAARRGEFGFSFDAPVASVGAFFNQLQKLGTVNTLTLLAYDVDGNTLESFNYSIDTGATGHNEGKFLGFQHEQADIYGFGVADGSFVMDNLVYNVSAVPEPGSMALVLAGLSFMGLVTRRKMGR